MQARTKSAVWDRARLEGLVDLYLEALAANDPARLPAAPDVPFAENYQPLRLGEGTWGSITGLGTYRHTFADPETSQVGCIATVRESGTPAALDLRLKLDGDRICEIETFIIRDALCCIRLEAMGEPEDLWLQPVPPAERVSRATLITTVDKYFQSMQRNDGKGDYSFFHPECQRIEHGLQTTNVKTPMAYGHSHDTDFASMTAEQQWKTGFLGFVTEIRDRRFVIVDEERQAAFAFASFDHNGTIRQIDLTTGKVFVIPPYFDVPRTLQIMEAFRLKGDRLHRIEMTLTELPYGTRPARWGDAPAPRRRGPASPADEAALAGLVDRVLQAMAAHDPAGLPLAPDVRYTEDGQDLKVGDGLWGTLSAYAARVGAGDLRWRLDLTQPAAGEAVFLGAIREQSTPGMLNLRIRLEAGRIAEIEAVAVRQEEVGERGGTVTLFQPRLLNQFDGAGFARLDATLLEPLGDAGRVPLAAAVDRYFEGLVKGSSRDIPFGEGCTRRDNGAVTANNPDAPPLDPAQPAYRPFALGCAEQIDSGLFKRISRVRELRHVAIDEMRGLVLSIAVLDNPGRLKAIEVAGVGRVALPGVRAEDPAAGQGRSLEEIDVLFGNRREANVVVPTSELLVQLTKLKDGRIVAIETVSRGGPFGMTAGWAAGA